MTDTYAYTLRGHLTARSPISVSYIGLDGALPRTPHGQVFLNGGTLRGPLRKSALNVVLRETAKDTGMPLAQMYMLGQGVDTTREVNNEDTGKSHDPMAEKRLRELNPLLNLMGRWKLAGRLEVQPLLTPATNVVTAGQGVRHDQFERDPELVEWLDDAERDRLLETLASSRASMDDIKVVRDQVNVLKKAYRKAADDPDERKRISQQLTELDGREKAIREAREGGTESIKHPLAGHESIAPGSELSCTLRINGGTAVDLGLLLHSLADFSITPHLGGHRAGGFGAVSGQWTVYRRASGELKAEPIGEVTLDDLGFQIEGESLTEAWDAFVAALPDMDLSVYLLSQARERQEA